MIYKSFLRIQASGTLSDNEWQGVKMSSRTSDNKWYNEWQRTTTIGTASDKEWQRLTTIGTASDKEWQRLIQRVTTSVNKWQWVTASDRSGITNENGTEHFKEWMSFILSITKTDILLLPGMDDCN